MKQKYFITVLNFINGCAWLVLRKNHSTGFINYHFEFNKEDAIFLKN